jgi:selenocysteine-specific elongation factor
VRNAQANRTVGGGQVLDPNAPDRKRRSPQRQAWLDALSAWLQGAELDVLLRQAPAGLDAASLTRLAGVPAQDLAVPENAMWVAAKPASAGRVLVLQSQWSSLGRRVCSTLDSFHETSPDEAGVEGGRLRRMALPTLPEPLWLALRDQLLERGELVRNGPWLLRPGHGVALSDAEQVLAERILPLLHEGAFDPPWVRDLSARLGVPEDQVRQLLRKLLRKGQVLQVVRDLFYHIDRIRELAALAQEAGQVDGLSAARFRDLTGLGRKRAIQVLECFDRLGFLRRVKDRHIVRSTSVFF